MTIETPLDEELKRRFATPEVQLPEEPFRSSVRSRVQRVRWSRTMGRWGVAIVIVLVAVLAQSYVLQASLACAQAVVFVFASPWIALPMILAAVWTLRRLLIVRGI